MPPAFVLSQNQTLKLMYDRPPVEYREARPASPGAVPAQKSQSGVFAFLRHMSSSPEASFDADPLRNGINLTDRPIPRGYRRPGRRPHVPSSKPTMSKSRRASSPGSNVPGIGCTDQEEARNERRPATRPRPLLEPPYMGGPPGVNRVFCNICCSSPPDTPQRIVGTSLKIGARRPGSRPQATEISFGRYQALWI